MQRVMVEIAYEFIGTYNNLNALNLWYKIHGQKGCSAIVFPKDADVGCYLEFSSAIVQMNQCLFLPKNNGHKGVKSGQKSFFTHSPIYGYEVSWRTTEQNGTGPIDHQLVGTFSSAVGENGCDLVTRERNKQYFTIRTPLFP